MELAGWPSGLVKVLFAGPGGLSSVPGPQMVEGELSPANRLRPPHIHCGKPPPSINK